VAIVAGTGNVAALRAAATCVQVTGAGEALMGQLIAGAATEEEEGKVDGVFTVILENLRASARKDEKDEPTSTVPPEHPWMGLYVLEGKGSSWAA
jgi:hypothetical protein